MKDNNVIIISEDREKAEKIISKILLLRSVDSVGIMNYDAAKELLKSKSPDLILVHVRDYDDVDLIQQIRFSENMKKTSIIMLSEFEDSDLLCKAFDAGIDDFMNIDCDETTLIMRIMWGLKKKLILDASSKKSDILSLIDVTDKSTGFYKKTYTQKVFNEEFNDILKQKGNVVFLIVALDLKYKSTVTVQGLGNVIKKIIRTSDTVGFAPDGKFYLLLYQTNEIGAKCVFERINKNITQGASVSAASMQVATGCFADSERILNKQLGQALIETNTLIFLNDEFDKTKPGAFDKSALKENNLKIIKRVFLNKIEKLVTPAFFKMQAIYEPKFFDTKISQNINDKESIFLIKSENSSAQIVVKYGDYTKLSVEITDTHKGESHSEKINFEPNELTSERLENIIQTVAEKYRKMLYGSEEE